MNQETQTSGLAAATRRILANPETRAIIYGEVDHGHNAFLKEFSSQDHMDAQKQNNVTAIALEMPKSFQQKVDDFSANRIDRNQFTSFLRNNFQFLDSTMSHLNKETSEERRNIIAHLIETAPDREIRVLFIDEPPSLNSNVKANHYFDKLQDSRDDIRLCIERSGVMSLEDLDNNGIVNIEHMKDMAGRLRAMERLEAVGRCINQHPNLAVAAHDITTKRFNEDGKKAEAIIQEAGSGKVSFYYGTAHGSTLASRIPGKVEGIVGLNPSPGVSATDKSEFIRLMTPFFRYHYDVETGGTSEPSYGIKSFLQQFSLPRFFPSLSAN